MLDWLRARIEALLAKVPGDLFDTEPDEESGTPSFQQVSYFDFDEWPLTPVKFVPAPPDDSDW